MATIRRMRILRNSEAGCYLLWLWANDPGSMVGFGRTEVIPWAEHVRWYRRMARHTRIVALDDGQPIGYVRIEPGRDGRSLSYAVAPESRGRGHAKAMLTAVGWPADVYANVNWSNVASCRVFEGLGWQRSEVGTGRIRYLPNSEMRGLGRWEKNTRPPRSS